MQKSPRMIRLAGYCNAAIVLLILGYPRSLAIGQTVNGNAIPNCVVMFLSDGGGMVHLEIARQYRKHIHDEGVVIVDKIMKEGSVGVMTTHAANSLSTDSAAPRPRWLGDAKPISAHSACAPTALWRSASHRHAKQPADAIGDR